MISKKRTAICKLCMNKEINLTLNSFFEPELLCQNCQNAFAVDFYRRKVGDVQVLSLYQYNEIFKDALYRFKARGDIELGSIFLFSYRHYLQIRYQGFVIVMVPSTDESDKNRGFNHVEIAFKYLHLPVIHCLKKVVDFKQSDLNYNQRQTVGAKLKIEGGEGLSKKKVLIVDDLFTTGATIKAVIKMIKPFKPKKIEVLTLAYTKLIDK